jgi:hypothetical protein
MLIKTFLFVPGPSSPDSNALDIGKPAGFEAHIKQIASQTRIDSQIPDAPYRQRSGRCGGVH